MDNPVIVLVFLPIVVYFVALEGLLCLKSYLSCKSLLAN